MYTKQEKFVNVDKIYTCTVRMVTSRPFDFYCNVHGIILDSFSFIVAQNSYKW